MSGGSSILVTGGRGFVGARLVQMLHQAGNVNILSLDVKPILTDQKLKGVKEVVGDFTNLNCVLENTKNVHTVYHVGGLVGPYYPENLYHHVNVEGTKNILDACKQNNVKCLIFCSSPSTRFKGPNGHDINGLSEKELDYPSSYTHLYSETKALAEKLVLAANSESLLTCSVAPHQVYGPGDQLFFPPVIANAEAGRLRIIGDGKNLCSYTFVDNICHALMLAGNNIEKNPQIRG
jgi:nucleoside-diphosphate-sugar epimerase